MSSLTPEQIKIQLTTALTGWTLDNNQLHKEYQFEDIGEAMGFMTQVAFYAKELEHYPVWTNYFSTVTVIIGSQDVGILGRDIQLAKRMEYAFNKTRPDIIEEK